MRSWETKHITDILIKHYKELSEASCELAEGGDHQGAVELDDEAICIEQHLEETWGIEWDGLCFRDKIGYKVCKS